jgi:hypothetical protein
VKVARVAQPGLLEGHRVAVERLGAVLGLVVVPALLAFSVVGGAIGHRFAFDFHGVIWQPVRDVAHGSNPHPPPTATARPRGHRP